jgi:hypothetical protein
MITLLADEEEETGRALAGARWLSGSLIPRR